MMGSLKLCILATIFASLAGLTIARATDDDKKSAEEKPNASATDDAKKDAETTDKDGWKPLFNGKDLDEWKITNFGGEGEVFLEDDTIVITQGADLSGIHTEQELPKTNYEVQFEAQRAAGSDFFAGLTFPVKGSHCSLIVGGWGGGVCGISSLNGMDAAENETTSYRDFEKGQWYKIRLTVTDEHINAWIDDKKIVDVDITDQRISTRIEVDRSKPFGFATYQTTGKLRNARLRPLPKTEEKPATKDKDKDEDDNKAK